jgi:ABC-type glycerol-3-phosphate transport system substrate-binding protein
MKHLKIFIVVLVVVSLIPLIILARGDNGDDTADEEMVEEVITLRIVWENWGADFTKYLDGDWTEKYEADHPNIKLEWLFPASWQEKEIAELAGGEMTFDVFYMRPSFLPAIVERGGLIPLNDYFAKSGVKTDDFVEATIRTCMIGDTIYAIPGGADFIGWFVNKDILREVGYDPDNPNINSIEDIEDAALTVNRYWTKTSPYAPSR